MKLLEHLPFEVSLTRTSGDKCYLCRSCFRELKKRENLIRSPVRKKLGFETRSKKRRLSTSCSFESAIERDGQLRPSSEVNHPSSKATTTITPSKTRAPVTDFGLSPVRTSTAACGIHKSTERKHHGQVRVSNLVCLQ